MKYAPPKQSKISQLLDVIILMAMTFGGSKSSGPTHAADITLQRPPAALVIITTGP